MICNIIDSIQTFLLKKENWQMIIIPILAPVLTIFGTYWMTLSKIRREQKAKELESEQNLYREKKDVLDGVDMMVTFALTNHLPAINKMKSDTSFGLLKFSSLVIFANEPLVLLNQVSKSRLDFLFDRHEIVDKEDLVVYGNFLTSRQLFFELYQRLNVWADRYSVKHEQLNAEFSDALLNFLNYLEVVSVSNDFDNAVKTLFNEFLVQHERYSNSNRFETESEVSVVNLLVDDLVEKMKTNGFFFKLDDFQRHYLKLELSIINTRTFCQNNHFFLNRIEKAMHQQIGHMKSFESTFIR